MTQMEMGQEALAAAEWLACLESLESKRDCREFLEWLSKDPARVRHLLELYALRVEARCALRESPKLRQRVQLLRSRLRLCLSAAVTERRS